MQRTLAHSRGGGTGISGVPSRRILRPCPIPQVFLRRPGLLRARLWIVAAAEGANKGDEKFSLSQNASSEFPDPVLKLTVPEALRLAEFTKDANLKKSLTTGIRASDLRALLERVPDSELEEVVGSLREETVNQMIGSITGGLSYEDILEAEEEDDEDDEASKDGEAGASSGKDDKPPFEDPAFDEVEIDKAYYEWLKENKLDGIQSELRATDIDPEGVELGMGAEEGEGNRKAAGSGGLQDIVGQEEAPYGEPSVLCAGFELPEVAQVRAILDSAGGQGVKVVPCSDALLRMTVGEALAQPEPDWERPRPESTADTSSWGRKRTVLVGGMNLAAQLCVVSLLEESGLPPLMVAVASEENEGEVVGEVMARALTEQDDLGRYQRDMMEDLARQGKLSKELPKDIETFVKVKKSQQGPPPPERIQIVQKPAPTAETPSSQAASTQAEPSPAAAATAAASPQQAPSSPPPSPAPQPSQEAPEPESQATEAAKPAPSRKGFGKAPAARPKPAPPAPASTAANQSSSAIVDYLMKDVPGEEGKRASSKELGRKELEDLQREKAGAAAASQDLDPGQQLPPEVEAELKKMAEELARKRVDQFYDDVSKEGWEQRQDARSEQFAQDVLDAWERYARAQQEALSRLGDRGKDAGSGDSHTAGVIEVDASPVAAPSSASAAPSASAQQEIVVEAESVPSRPEAPTVSMDAALDALMEGTSEPTSDLFREDGAGEGQAGEVEYMNLLDEVVVAAGDAQSQDRDEGASASGQGQASAKELAPYELKYNGRRNEWMDLFTEDYPPASFAADALETLLAAGTDPERLIAMVRQVSAALGGPQPQVLEHMAYPGDTPEDVERRRVAKALREAEEERRREQERIERTQMLRRMAEERAKAAGAGATPLRIPTTSAEEGAAREPQTAEEYEALMAQGKLPKRPPPKAVPLTNKELREVAARAGMNYIEMLADVKKKGIEIVEDE